MGAGGADKGRIGDAPEAAAIFAAAGFRGLSFSVVLLGLLPIL
jgi:hypothetical protein